MKETDDLTGLPARGTFMERFAKAAARAERESRPLCLLVIDVDHLKIFNDHYGHLVGDDALRAVAGVLRNTLRSNDLPGRYGGDEFVVLLPATGLAEGLAAAKRVRAAAETTRIPLPDSAATLRLSLSIGIACLPDDGVDVQTLFAVADRGAYAAKAAGRNAVRHAPTSEDTELPEPILSPPVAGRMVGRSAELTRLGHLLAAMLRAPSAGGMALVEGEAGIGKSRLLLEFITLASALGVRVLSAPCHKSERATPYYPFLAALAPHLAEAPFEVFHGAGPLAPQIARMLPSRTEILPDAVAPPPGMPQGERARSLDAMTRLIMRLVDGGSAAQPTIVILDGLQWADEDSIHLLYRLARAAAGLPLMLVGTVCPEEAVLSDGSPANPALQEAIVDLERLGLLRERIALAPLKPGEMRALLQAAGGATLGVAERRRLIAAAGGNPLFLLENLRGMQFARPRRATAPIPHGALPIPHALAAILSARLSGLDQAARTVLAAIAMLPWPIDASFLAAAFDPATLPSLLARLSRPRLLIAVEGDVARYTLVYPQVSTIILEELGSQRRAMLRRHIARTVVATGTPHAVTEPRAGIGARPAVLTAHLLGGCTITYDGHRLTQSDVTDPDAWTLLLALLITPGHRLPDAVAGAILWPERDVPPRGRLSRLVRDSALLARAREPLVVRRAGRIAFRQGLDLGIDVDHFESAATRAVAGGEPAALHAAYLLYAGPLLPALAGAGWATRRREEIAVLHQRLSERAADQPTSTVSFLHVATAEVAARPGEDRGSAIQREARIAAIVVRHGGYPIDQQEARGSHGAIFADPAAALSAAVAVANRVGDGQPEQPPDSGTAAAPVAAPSAGRIAIYTGTVEVLADMYDGSTRYRCAKLCELAHPGQILAGYATYAALGTPPDGVRLQSLGSHLLPGTRHVEEVYQILHTSLSASFPPLGSAAHRHVTNLSPALTSFVGRRREMADVAALLQIHPLVTLTGAGGAGKTRLALEVAGVQVGAHEDGVWIVELAAIQQPALVPPAIAGALGLEDASSATLQTLLAYLGAKRMLLLLDNCEHMIDACAEVTTGLLRACPGLTILATSREPLDIAGESLYVVPPLSVPDGRTLPDLARLAGYEGVALFLERARARRYGFALTPENVPHIVRICAQLDGIPLAIELAAARVTTLDVDEIAQGLDACFEVLNAGPRSALPRHRTLRAAFDWSYALLDERCRTLLRRLAVFIGGWTLDAAGAVCADDILPGIHVAASLDDLAGKSLLTLDGERYRLLEITRHYGWDHLGASGELSMVRDRHLAWCVALAERCDHELTGPEQATWLTMLEGEHDNFRAALAWSIAEAPGQLGTGEVAGERRLAGLRLATALEWFWSVRNYWIEGHHWLEQVLAANPAAPPALRARALVRAGALAERRLDFVQGKGLLEQALLLLRALDDRPGIAGALRVLGNMALWQKEYDEATARYEESLDLLRALDDRRGMAGTLNNLGLIAKQFADYDRATDLFFQALAICREFGHHWGIAVTLDNLGFTAQLQGHAARAIDLHRQSLILWRELGDEWSIANDYVNIGYATHGSGDHLEALNYFAQGLSGFRTLGDRQKIGHALDGMAYCAAALGQPRRAVEIHAAVESFCRQAGIDQQFMDDAAHPGRLASLRASLGERAYAEAWAAGCALTLETACTQARRIQSEAVARAIGAPA